LLLNTATQDGKRVTIGFGQDPGQAGKSQAQHLVRALSGFTVRPATESGDKLTRFGPFSSQCRAGNVKIRQGSWNEELFRILEGFPDLAHDDEVDACSGALEMLNQEMKGLGIYQLYRDRAAAAAEHNKPQPVQSVVLSHGFGRCCPTPGIAPNGLGRFGRKKSSHSRYWMTSSASCSSDSGTVRPSALAVRSLMTSSNLTGAWTGSSLGFAPRRCGQHRPRGRRTVRGCRHLEGVNGPIPTPVACSYVWGDALTELKRAAPQARIINLETSITKSRDYATKGINYKMNPKNIVCLTAAGVDCCVLANNHVIGFGEAGLCETLDALKQAGIRRRGRRRSSKRRMPAGYWCSHSAAGAAAYRLNGPQPTTGLGSTSSPTCPIAPSRASPNLPKHYAGKATFC
jgi:predicted phage terminase large subunit-like protein